MLSSNHQRGTSVDVPQVRLLVVGDSGVGKSSIVHRLCHGEYLKNPSWTLGCDVEVKLHLYAKRQGDFFIEFWDVGGAHKYKITRHVFYSQLNGIIFVYDVKNRNSYKNLRNWISEIKDTDCAKLVENYSCGKTGAYRHVTTSVESLALTSVVVQSRPEKDKRLCDLPVFVVGNKADVEDEKTERDFNTLKDFGIEGCFLSAKNWDGAPRLNEFIESVVERRHYAPSQKQTSGKTRSWGQSTRSWGQSTRVVRPRP